MGSDGMAEGVRDMRCEGTDRAKRTWRLGKLARACIALVSAAACAPAVPLSDAPIVGGTAEQRVIIREVLEEVGDHLDLPVELRRVRFANVNEHRWGVYNSVTKTVRLDPVLTEETLRFTLRHELCHAIDFQHDLAPADPQLDAVANWYRRRGWMDQTATRASRREAFALACGEGAAVIDAVAGACEGDEVSVTDLAVWLGTEVWAGHEPVDVVLRSTVPFGLDSATGMIDHEVFLSDDLGDLHVFDPMTGVERAFGFGLVLMVGESIEWPGFEGGDGWVGGWQGGPAVATITPPMTGSSRVLVQGRDGRWGGFGCSDDVEPFFTEGRAWLAKERRNEQGVLVTDFFEVDP